MDLSDKTGMYAVIDAQGEIVREGKVLLRTSPSVTGPKTVGYQYDAVGNRSQMVYPDGRYLNYYYSQNNQLYYIIDWAGRMTYYANDLSGMVNYYVTMPNYTQPNQQYMHYYQFDDANRALVRGTYVMQNSQWNPVAVDMTDKDAVGNDIDVTHVRQNQASTLDTYAFDPLYRLTSVNYNGAQTDTYSYDAVGNRLSKNAISYTYDNADQMTLAGGVASTYDNNGSQISRGRDVFAWDRENRVSSATVSGANQLNTYNGDGLRVRRQWGVTDVSYVWDVAGGLPTLLQDGSKTYVYGDRLLYTADGTGAAQTGNLTWHFGDKPCLSPY